MDFVKFCKDKKYVHYNVKNKQPILGAIGWSKVTYEEALKHHQSGNNDWGMRTGYQENGDHIIGLDFDMWYKSGGEYVESINTKKLYKEFQAINPENIGVFSSSTELNRGCLVNIKNSSKIQEILEKNGSSKIEKKDFCLEVLNGFNMVIPPTTTICKKRKKAIDARTFLSDTHILEIEAGSELEEFIYNYLDAATDKAKITKTDLRTKEKLSVYEKYENQNIDLDEFKDMHDIIKKFLFSLDKNRVKNYNEWYKIGYALKNTLGLEGWDIFNEWSKTDNNNYNETYNKELFEKWQSDKYPYTMSYILKYSKIDNKDIFLDTLILFQAYKAQNELIKTVRKFEENVKKILEPSIWIKKNRRVGGDWEYTTKEDIIHTYSEIAPFNKNGFLNSYFKNQVEKEYFDFVDFVPSLKKIEDENGLRTFNMFKGFEIDKYNKETEADDKYKNWFIKHIKNTCCNDINAEEMLIQYLAHCIFNTTKRPGICIILQGLEGTGKSILFEIIKEIIGHKYCLMSERAEKDIFDRFNNQMKNKILININEPDFDSFKGGFEAFKSLITDTTYTIEEKNLPSINVSNYLWFLVTTNNEVLFKLSHTDRRFYFIKTSDEILNDKTHFQIFGEYMESNKKEFIFSIYKYLESRYNPNYDFKFNQKENKTELHKLLVDNSKSKFHAFIQELVEDIDNLDKGELDNTNENIIISPKDFNSLYKKYCRDNSFFNVEGGNKIRMNLKSIDTNIHRKVKNLSRYVINIKQVIEYLKMKKLYEE